MLERKECEDVALVALLGDSRTLDVHIRRLREKLGG